MQDKKERKRDMILDTAFDLILKNGYSNAKIIDIAISAGIGKGTIYEYFDSKEALVLDLINERVRQDFLKVCSAMDEAPTCKQKLENYFRLEIETAAKYKTNVNDFAKEFMHNNTEISMEIVEAVHSIAVFQFESVLKVIQEGIASGEFKSTDPLAAAACFTGSISFYLSLLHFDLPGNGGELLRRIPPVGNAEAFLDCVFNGLLP